MQEPIHRLADSLIHYLWSPGLTERFLSKYNEDEIELILSVASKISGCNYGTVKYPERTKLRVLKRFTIYGMANTYSDGKYVNIFIRQSYNRGAQNIYINTYGGIHNNIYPPGQELIITDGCEALIDGIINIPNIAAAFELTDIDTNLHSGFTIRDGKYYEHIDARF